MLEKHFQEAPFTWKQRAAFWAAFLYYMSSAALLLTGPFPALAMIWFFPQHIYPHNYLPMLPAIAATLFVFPLLSRGWRPTIFRVCMINSCCHMYAVWYALRPVILGFGHEMNGSWYSWGYRHTSPAVFVATWRHIVTVFRDLEVRNVTWLWTVNIVHPGGSIASPAPWWPGNKYVTWVGLDGYYYKPSWKFAPLFGPTIAAVRELTHDPMLIAETSVSPTANQPAKINDLFAGIRLYGLLGFVWFNSVHNVDWRLSNPSAIEAFRQRCGDVPSGCVMSDEQPSLQASSGHIYLNEHAGFVTKTTDCGLATYLRLREPGQRRLV